MATDPFTFELIIALLSYGVPSLIGGSGPLASYVSGIMIGVGRVPHSGGIRRVHDSMAWLAQLPMFLLLGLLVTPSELVKAAVDRGARVPRGVSLSDAADGLCRGGGPSGSRADHPGNWNRS